MLDALGAPAGKDDDRTRDQRYHDALAEAMRRLVASDLLPERAGQPVKAWVHISLADLLLLDGDSALAGAVDRAGPGAVGRAAGVRVRDRQRGRRLARRRRRRGGRVRRGDGPAGHRGRQHRRPGGPGRLCVELDRHRRAAGPAGGPDTPACGTTAAADTTAAWAALEQAVIGKAVDLLSGPGGLAGFLRRRQLGVRLGGPSLPLDIGYSESIPAGIRNAVTLRDRKCRWAGGCDQPASACDVHHVKHKKHGGKTSARTASCSVFSTTRS